MKAFDRKLRSVAVMVISVIACGFILHFFWWSIFIWILLSTWAAWRYVLRYLMPGSFICYRCGRLKCAKALSVDDPGQPKICDACEERHKELLNTFCRMEQNLASIKELAQLKREEERLRERSRTKKPENSDEEESLQLYDVR